MTNRRRGTNAIDTRVARGGVAIGLRRLVAGLLTVACAARPGPIPSTGTTRSGLAPVVHVDGSRLVGPDGRPLTLHAITFGNRVWSGDRLPLTHHDQRDFGRVAAMGFNTVRFLMTYRTFESDGAPGQWLADGWKWLDDNVRWARESGVYLVPSIHVPPGGLRDHSEGPRTLWKEAKMQDRLVALWRAIAARYAREPGIAGYSLLNEPITDQSIADWKALADRAVAAIREVDRSHVIFVERVSAAAGDWSDGPGHNFVRVADTNVVYDFKFFKPFQFTHQGAPWVPSVTAAARYPDEKIAEVEWFHLKYRKGTFGSPVVPRGDSDWKYYQGEPFAVSNPEWAVSKPALAASRVGEGTCQFSDIVLARLDARGEPVEEVFRENLDTTRGWFFWKQSGGGLASVAAEGHGDRAAISVSGTTDEANLSGDKLIFRPTVGATYRLSGWMKGDHIPAGAVCQIRLDFSSSDVAVQARDRAYLEQEIDTYVAWSRREGVPLFLSGFGTIKASFEDDHGGLRWVSDMLDVLLARDLGFSYHDYHEPAMGLYDGDLALPDPGQANQPLIDLFRAKLRPEAPRTTAAPLSVRLDRTPGRAGQ